jgi:adenine-specific DNA-methyltransferase
MNEQYSPLTIAITKQLSKTEKKDFGIFITPKCIIQKMISSILRFVALQTIIIRDVLEPSCGTCEIIKYIDSTWSNVQLTGVELNDTIFGSIKDMSFKNKVTLINGDFLKYKSDKLYDLIIGNPPYFVMKKEKVPPEYKEYINGRPNIFGLFILHSISLLKPGGILAFVISKSFLNSVYYSKIREYIKNHCEILTIEDYENMNQFIDTEQATFGIILRKFAVPKTEFKECVFSIKLGEIIIFTDNSIKLKELLEGATTIENLGLKVRTGQIVWNEHKDKLTNDKKGTPLIYNTNITKENTVELKEFRNEDKGQYINLVGRTEPILVVNRGNGNSTYKLQYALIQDGPYLVENHLNEIYYPNSSIKKEDVIVIYSKIIASFKNPKTQQFIDMFLGNNGLSKSELEQVLPIYL